ncbi:MAG: hypothetical protein Q4A43_05515 [Coriobacteriia bacterium]|nr:hypothetical protein [Coriobacteriia bacterium]
MRLRRGGDISQETLNENDGKYTIDSGGIYNLTEDIKGSICADNPSSEVRIKFNGHKLTNENAECSALSVNQTNEISVTIDGQGASVKDYGSIVQAAGEKPAIDISASCSTYFHVIEVSTKGSECLEAQKGITSLTNVSMSGSDGGNSLIHACGGATVSLNSGTYKKSDSAQSMFQIDSGGKIEISGGFYSAFPKGVTLRDVATLYKNPAGDYFVLRADAESLKHHCWKVTLDDNDQLIYTGNTKDIYFGLKSEAVAFAGDKYAVEEIYASTATALTDDSVSLEASSYIYDGTEKKPKVTVVVDGKTLTEGSDYELSYRSNVEVGTAYAVVEGMNGYAGTVEKAFTISKAAPSPTPVTTDLSAAKVTLSKASFTYNGKAQKPSVKSVVLNSKTLVAGTDYTASVASGKKVGTYAVTITAKGSYTGKATASFTVNPKGVTKFKVPKAKKSFKAKWAKNKTERSGVQIKYSTKKSMANAKTVKAKGAAAKAKTVKKLKKKTKYYVQVRAYKVVNGKTYYSGWSVKKAVKTK